jgi:probable blue pigment (indigoidine) exporter
MNRFLFGFLVVLTTGLMGSSFSVGKIGLEYISPLLLVGIRFTLAGVLMILFVMRRKHPQTVTDWLRMAIIGAFQTAGVMACIFVSMRTITASESSILTFINPLLVVVLATVFMKARYRLLQWAGVFIGLIGVFITLGFHLHLHFGTGLGLLGAVLWACATLLIKCWNTRFDVWVLSAWQMFFGGILLLIGSVTLEKPVFVVNVISVSIILWLAVMASVVQFTIWFYLLTIGDPGKTSVFLFLAPLFGVISGWIILGEEVKWPLLIGGSLIIVAIALVNSPDLRMEKKHWQRNAAQ